MMNKISFLIVFLGGLISGFLVSQYLLPAPDDQSHEVAVEHAAKHLMPGYVCPMHPGVVSNEPGSCPICGMDLEIKELSDEGSDGSGIAVSSAMSNSLGVRIAHAERGRISEQVFASGSVETVTPATVSEIKTKINGKVKEVFARVGDWVAEGEFILSIESAEFKKVQDAYLLAQKNRDYQGMKEIRKQLAAMDSRQAVLDGTDRINDMELTPEFILEAPHSGILEMSTDVGTELKINQKIARVKTDNIARVRLRSYARAARAVKRGRHAQLDLPHMPGKKWPGRVIEVEHGDAGFYSSIQADFEVPKDATERGVFVGAYVNAGTNAEALRIPSTAVILVEGQSRVVQLLSSGKFQPVDVEVGFVGAEWAEIKSGLEEGDAVVVRAQFLIDSESTLRAGFSRLAE
ncbi:MAG: hypothetical protein DIZ80_02615 [endosymbiont of Galathealinum brachiosum]|uniref:Heavy metal binding domain-containing protein n=1 Tax=endosymbiont of Galathealinum brachiosum TaxID=2200906 RepID=A0A370DJX6_9GAMM|nr:MAG: hypothetical protein DIZ80_02615 [endosymbiont of Galathealinum brachiosum]